MIQLNDCRYAEVYLKMIQPKSISVFFIPSLEYIRERAENIVIPNIISLRGTLFSLNSCYLPETEQRTA
jgi:hypothetical protein